MVRRSLRQSAADTPLADWLVEYGESRGWETGRQAAKYLKIKQAAFSTWLRGEVEPGREYQEQLAAATGRPLPFIAQLVRRTKEQKRAASAAATDTPHVDAGDAPPMPAEDDTGVRRQLAEIRETLGQIGRALAASPAPFVHAGRPDTTPARIVEFSGAGAVRPMIVQTDQLADAGLPPGSVAWVDPTGVPSDGKIVRVGEGEFARLKRYAPGDEVTGVVVLVQYSPP